MITWKHACLGSGSGAMKAAGLAAILAVTLAPGGHAQIDRPKAVIEPALILAEASATNPETVRLLAALGKIESDLQLGMLFMQDGLTASEGSHFAHPRVETFPGIKDGLAAAGVADIEPLLAALEAGGDAATVTANYQAVITAIMMARSTLKPTNHDVMLAILAQTEAVVGEINAAGPTEAANYQDAWSMLMVARYQIDLLLGDTDPAVVSSATDMGLAMDDVILTMPDPAVNGPVEFDPAPLVALKARMEELAGTI
jgi:hypothetical protein